MNQSNSRKGTEAETNDSRDNGDYQDEKKVDYNDEDRKARDRDKNGDNDDELGDVERLLMGHNDAEAGYHK